jgi:hypothetical protein
MAHPANAFPKDLYQLSGGVALALTDRYVYAMNNPTSAEISATVQGSNYTVTSGSYRPASGDVTITVQPGATVYGRFTSVTGDGLICYVD